MCRVDHPDSVWLGVCIILVMIIWRGWGVLGILPFLCFGLGVAIWTGPLGNQSAPWPLSGPLIVLGGLVTYLLGQRLNRTGVSAKAEKMLELRRAELDELVYSDRFQLAPGHPVPSSVAEAESQAEQLYRAEAEQLSAALTNRHTLFFIPVQYIGAIAVAGGAALSVIGLLQVL